MRKIRILGVAPYRGMVTLMEQCALLYPDIELHAIQGNMEQGLELAKTYHTQYDAIISRGNTASMISEALPIPVTDIGIGYYDVLRCIKMAEHTKTRFAIIGFHSLTDIAKNLCDLLQMQVDIFSFSPNTWKDCDRLLDQMKAQGYETVICDMIPYDYAKLIGITPILLTSSSESLCSAMEHTIENWQKNQQLLQSLSMLQTLVRSSSNQYLILDAEGTCLYSTLEVKEADALLMQLQKELPHCCCAKNRSFFLTANEKLYSVRSALSEDQQPPYVIFRIMPSKIPPIHSKNGITIMDCRQALQSFIESFYSNTELARGIIASTEQLATASAPLMITGEVGTGKDRVAHIYYAKSKRKDCTLYVINCAMINDKTWRFVTGHYNSPFTDNGSTIYISNLEALSPARQKQLLSLILDTNLHVRNRLFFSCTCKANHPIPHVALEYSNMLGCIHIPIKPLREQREDIAPSASLYIDTLNQELGRQVVGLDEEAAQLLQEYDYPCNRTQFKRILKTAVLNTDTAYISRQTIEEILSRETGFFHEPGQDSSSPKKSVSQENSPVLDLNRPLDVINREIARHVLKSCGNNQTAAAKRLGISRTTLWRYIKD